MALRAGYYGVKRWLWDKLQSMPGKVDGLIESNNITGAKNFINNKDITAKSGATLTYTETGFTSVVSSASWSGAEYNRRCNANTDFILDLDTDITSGVTYVAVQGSSNGTSYTNIKTSAVLTADGHISIPFNTGDYTYLKIIFYTTNATATSCNVTISDITLYLASEPDKSYAPYAMTNQALTNRLVHAPIHATVSGKGLDFRLDRKDGLVIITAAGEASEAITNNTKIADLPSGYEVSAYGTVYLTFLNLITGGGIGVLDIRSNAIYANTAIASGDKPRGSITLPAGDAAALTRSLDAAPEERSLEVEEPVVVKKTTRKKTTKTEEEE